MAGQGVERREVLRLLALASAVSAAPGFQRWVFAFGEDDACAGNAPPRAESYVPRFFTPEEYALVALLASVIIPTDDTPGATEAGVSEFIDTMVAHDVPLQPRFRGALAWVEARSRLRHGRPFAALSSEEQVAFLEPLAYAAKHRDGDEEGRRFFNLLREYTVMGFYTSRVGLEQLGDPGLATYAESPGCPDPSDPHHRHRSGRTAAALVPPPSPPSPARVQGAPIARMASARPAIAHVSGSPASGPVASGGPTLGLVASAFRRKRDPEEQR
jgi:gluconate 2-dehydrogenase gamma chain